MKVIFTVSFLILLYLLMKWYVKTRRYVKHMRRYPSPPTVPIFGNALNFKSPVDFIPNFAEYTALLGNKVALYLGIFPNALLITDQRLMNYILSSNKILKEGKGYSFLTRWLGNELLIARGETAMGTVINSQDNNHSDDVKSVKLIGNLVTLRGFNAFLRTDLFYRFSKLYKEEQLAVKILHEYSENLIEQKKKVLHTQKKVDVDATGRTIKMALLDSLLQLSKDSKTCSDVHIRDEVNTFMFAGFDTSASALTFALFSLAENPRVQVKVVEELDKIFGDDKQRCFTLNDIQSMKYLEAVIKEVLRLYPPVPYLSRIVEEDFEFDGCTITEGCNLIINIYGLHHNSKVFSEPDTFNPERFLSASADDKISNGYLPFGFGSRSCIGCQKFAMFELKTVLAVLLRHYKLGRALPLHKIKLSTETVLVLKNGVFVSLSKRN